MATAAKYKTVSQSENSDQTVNRGAGHCVLTGWSLPLLSEPQRGSGVEVNHKLALELFRRAADLGDPQAQGMVGMRMAVGLHHYGSFEGASIRMFVPVCISNSCLWGSLLFVYPDSNSWQASLCMQPPASELCGGAWLTAIDHVGSLDGFCLYLGQLIGPG